MHSGSLSGAFHLILNALQNNDITPEAISVSDNQDVEKAITVGGKEKWSKVWLSLTQREVKQLDM